MRPNITHPKDVFLQLVASKWVVLKLKTEHSPTRKAVANS